MLLRFARPFEDCHVCVVGSAPVALEDARAVKGTSFEHTVAVNGSLPQARALVDNSFFSAVVDESVFNRSHIAANQGSRVVTDHDLLSGVNLRYLAVVRSNRVKADMDPKQHAQFQRIRRIGRYRRGQIIRRQTGAPGLDRSPGALVGTGLFAVALAFHWGARAVTMVGFGLRTGTSKGEYARHYYAAMGLPPLEPADGAEPEYWATRPRNHSAADAVVVASLCMGGRQITAYGPDFDVLMTNWGASPDFAASFREVEAQQTAVRRIVRHFFHRLTP